MMTRPIPKAAVEMSPNAPYGDSVEFSTVSELVNMKRNDFKMSMQALLVTERIFGKTHRRTRERIFSIGKYYKDAGYFQLCISLWLYGMELTLKYAEKEEVSDCFWYFTMEELFKEIVKICWGVGVEYSERIRAFQIGIDFLFRLSSGPKTRYVICFESWIRATLYFLHFILTYGRSELTDSQEYNLKKGVQRLVALNCYGPGGPTILHSACDQKMLSPKVIDILIEQGADPRSRDFGGNTPLHTLIKNPFIRWPETNLDSFKEILISLLWAGTPLNARNQKGETFTVSGYLYNWLETDVKTRGLLDYIEDEDNNKKRSWRPMQRSLKCLAGLIIRRHRIPYQEKGKLPLTLSQFVEKLDWADVFGVAP